MVFLQLFIAFFEIGLFGFGGGYAMISLIQRMVVTRTRLPIAATVPFIMQAILNQLPFSVRSLQPLLWCFLRSY